MHDQEDETRALLQSTIKKRLIETFVALFSQWQKKMGIKTFTKLKVTWIYLKICTYQNVGFMDRFNITHMHKGTIKVQFQCKWWKKRSTGLALYKTGLLNLLFCSILTSSSDKSRVHISKLLYSHFGEKNPRSYVNMHPSWLSKQTFRDFGENKNKKQKRVAQCVFFSRLLFGKQYQKRKKLFTKNHKCHTNLPSSLLFCCLNHDNYCKSW